MGDGIAQGNGDSPRMTILGEYDGVESTVYVKGSKGNCEVRPKTDHYCVAGGSFGGYNVNVNFDDNTMVFKKEWTHDIGYSPRLVQKTVTLPKDKWFGLRGKVYNIDNKTKVKVEGWLDINANNNWQKITEIIDDGTIKCGNAANPAKEYPPYTAKTKGSAIRVNNADDMNERGIQFKDFIIKSIV